GYLRYSQSQADSTHEGSPRIRPAVNISEGTRSSKTAGSPLATLHHLFSLCHLQLRLSLANPSNVQQSLWHGRAMIPLKFLEAQVPGFRKFVDQGEDQQSLARSPDKACRNVKPEIAVRVLARGRVVFFKR